MREKKIVYIDLESVDSTNEWIKREVHALNLEALTCVRARQQTAGKGSRQQRNWFSPADVNLYCSFFFTLEESTPIQHMAQLLALSGAKVCRELSFPVRLKWPNDLMIDDKKLGGVLVETLHLENRLGIIAGIGLNVNMTKEMLPSIDQKATSLLIESGISFSIEELSQRLAQQFLKDL